VRSTARSTLLNINVRFSGFYLEPPIGIEPMTYALREARDLAAYALAAPIARLSARMALAALGLPGDPFHGPFHAQGSYTGPASAPPGRVV